MKISNKPYGQMNRKSASDSHKNESQHMACQKEEHVKISSIYDE
jgi:hypothetical protein